MGVNWLTGVTDAAVPEELPVLAQTQQELRRLLADDGVPLRRLSMALMADPAMALRVLQRANAVPHRHFRTDVVMMEDAIQMLGTQAILQLDAGAKVADMALDDVRLASYRRSAGRSVLAALLALDWAELDRDRFPSEVSLAALLNNLGELFLLAHGDARINRYLELVEMSHVLPHEAEYVSLGQSLEDLGHLLAVQWGLPEMVREAMRARNARYPRTLCVMLATQIARDAFADWRHPQQSSDLRLAAALLNLDLSALMQRVNSVIGVFNRTAVHNDLKPLKLLPQYSSQRADEREAPLPAAFCLAPRADDYAACLNALSTDALPDREAVLVTVLRGLHHGLGLNRVVFAVYHPMQRTLTAEFMIGTDFEPSFNRFSLSLDDSAGFFSALLDAPAAIWLDEGNQDDLLPRIPRSIIELTGITHFFIMSVWVHGAPLGVIYADRRSESCHLDERSYTAFRRLVSQAAERLESLGVT